MRIINDYEEEDVITRAKAKQKVEARINNYANDYLYVVKFEGRIISFSTQYYKFAWKSLRDLHNALTNKFGKELAEALVENGVIDIVKVWM